MNKIEKLFAFFPEAELLARRIYKSNSSIQRYLKDVKKKVVHPEKNELKQIIKDFNISDLERILSNAGITKGDILIAHSSIDGLKRVNADENEVLDLLLNLVGQEGTLALPTFPKYKKIKPGQLPRYDYSKFIAWTGIIPNLFIMEKNARVSHLPMNTLSAYGRFADDMFDEEIQAVTTYGKYTPWDFCRLHHAKVLFLGVKPFHAISEVHIVEDLMNEEYPIQDWHEVRTYLVGTKGVFEERNYRIRKDFWSKYLVENYYQRKLLNDKMIRNVGNGVISAYLIDDLKKYVDYMIESVEHGDLGIFRVPKKFWKNKK